MTIKGLMVFLPTNLPDFEEPFLISLLNKESKIPIGITIDTSTFALAFMLQMNFSFLNVERIRGFTLNFVAIYFPTSCNFGFPYRSK